MLTIAHNGACCSHKAVPVARWAPSRRNKKSAAFKEVSGAAEDHASRERNRRHQSGGAVPAAGGEGVAELAAATGRKAVTLAILKPPPSLTPPTCPTYTGAHPPSE